MSSALEQASPTPVVMLHPVSGPPGSRLARLLGAGLEPVAPLRSAIGCFERVVAAVSGPNAASSPAHAGLPQGPASAEALAVRLRRGGAEMGWGAPHVVADLRSLLSLCRARGRSSVEIARADPSLITEMQVGAWFDAGWRLRALRRAAAGGRGATAALALRAPRSLAAVADLAFWAGVRESATPREWRRLTQSSYVVLVYHRFAGELKPGQERIDIAPARFAHHLRALHLAGFRALAPDEILSFHTGAIAELGRRRFAISVDDALADSVDSLRRCVGQTPQLFVSTQELGGSAHWLAGEPIASWSDVRDLAAAGVAVGSHGRLHQRLTSLTATTVAHELAGSLTDLRQRLRSPLEVVAYPYGDHDIDVCRAARTAGFRAGFTTEKGRNGAGTHPFCLRRVSVHGRDGGAEVLWKVVTGEALPALWLRLRASREGHSAA
jgi:peptidoglycan/xylan/chitin deacetylase (PgdA/CDA1 family)